MSISLPEELGDFVDRIAAERAISRSQLFARLVEAEQKSLMERELAEGYEALAEEHRSFSEAAGVADEVFPLYERSKPLEEQEK